MDFKTLAQNRYSVRSFKPLSVEQDKLDQLLDAARLAPTAGNRQPQRLMILQNAADLAKIDLCTRSRFGAPLVIIVCYDETACWVRPFDGANSGQVDASIITTHIMLQATDLGLGSTWVMHFDPVKLREEFKLADHLIPVALLVLGYPAEEAKPSEKHGERKELQEILL